MALWRDLRTSLGLFVGAKTYQEPTINPTLCLPLTAACWKEPYAVIQQKRPCTETFPLQMLWRGSLLPAIARAWNDCADMCLIYTITYKRAGQNRNVYWLFCFGTMTRSPFCNHLSSKAQTSQHSLFVFVFSIYSVLLCKSFVRALLSAELQNTAVSSIRTVCVLPRRHGFIRAIIPSAFLWTLSSWDAQTSWQSGVTRS